MYSYYLTYDVTGTGTEEHEHPRGEVKDSEAHPYGSDGSPRYGSNGSGYGCSGIRQDYARVMYERGRQPTRWAATRVYGWWTRAGASHEPQWQCSARAATVKTIE
jgi:hypothetical protein